MKYIDKKINNSCVRDIFFVLELILLVLQWKWNLNIMVNFNFMS